MMGETELNNGLTENDIEIREVPTKGHALEPYIYHIRISFDYDKKEPEQVKQQILNNQAIVEALQKELEETEESFLEAKYDEKRRILDYHSIMIRTVLNTTHHSKCSGGES